MIKVKHIRENEINDIFQLFGYEDENGNPEEIFKSYPRGMYTEAELQDLLN